MTENNGKITVQLSEPVEYGGETYSELTFRKMKAKDLVASDDVDGDMRKSIAIFASMAGVPMDVIAEMDGDDFVQMGVEVAPLMGKSAKDAVDRAQQVAANEEPGAA